MKLKIKVKTNINEAIPIITKQGDWIDLKAAENITLQKPNKTGYFYYEIPLGVAIKLPMRYEAIVAPRSSTYKKYGVIQTNSIGVIDHTYCGPEDIWKFPCIALKDGVISKGDRICQFRIQLSQKATWWQKVKNLFYSGVQLEYVTSLHTPNRGGFGSTGK